jgi:phosphate transport system substrate-binding protein
MATSADPMSSAVTSRRTRWRSVVLMQLVCIGTAAAVFFASALPAAADPTLQTTGSSFAGVAIQEWVGQASTLFGDNINWQVSSSVIGLNNFAQNQVDFAASDIPYSSDQSTYFPTNPYEYMPDVAGGLSFMYNLNGNDGQQINNLVLTSSLVDQIFLGEITNWNAPAIAAANPQLAGDLPNQEIIPVFRSDASGENYLLSDYMLHEDGANFTAAQNAFNSPNPGQPTAIWPVPAQGSNPPPSVYPGWGSGNLVGESGSDNAANYVAAVSSVGSITYVETAYAKEHNFPVASLMNASGNAVQPTSVNVATALEAAILHADLTQDLTNVYTNPAANAYPLSAYSYLVTPCSPQLAAAQGSNCASSGPGNPATGPTSPFPPNKGQELGQFVAFLACAGQEKMALLGYSPLPANLVQEDFNAIGRMPGGQEPPPVSPATCQNPYVTGALPSTTGPTIVGQTGAAGSGSGATAKKPGGSVAGGKAPVDTVTGPSSAASGSSSPLTPEEIAAGYKKGANGQLVPVEATQKIPAKYPRIDALTSAIESIVPPHVIEYVIGALLFLAAVFGPPLFGMRRRRRGPGAHTARGKEMAA